MSRDSFSRRSFLESAGAVTVAAAVAGCTGDGRQETTSGSTTTAGGGGQATTTDGPDGGDGNAGDRPLFLRRMVFPYPERLGDDLRQKIIIVTDRKDKRPDQLKGVDQKAVGECTFDGRWPPKNLNVWEGLLVDARNSDQLEGFFGPNPTVRATQLVERNTIFVEGQPSEIPLGTPFVVSSVDKCPGDLVGVEATKIPGVEVKTGSGVSTGGTTTQ